MKNGNNLTTIGFLIIGLLLVTVIGGSFEVSRLLTERNKLREETVKLRERSEQLLTLNSEVNNLDLLQSNWLSRLPMSEAEIELIVEDLEQTASANQLSTTLQIDDFPIQVDLGGKVTRGLVVEMGLTGDLNNLAAFLNSISDKNYFLRIDRIQVNNDRVAIPNSAVEGVLFLE